MDNYEYLKFMLELLDLMIKKFEDLEWESYKGDSIKRIHYANESLKKAYCIAEVLIDKGGI